MIRVRVRVGVRVRVRVMVRVKLRVRVGLGLGFIVDHESLYERYGTVKLMLKTSHNYLMPAP